MRRRVRSEAVVACRSCDVVADVLLGQILSRHNLCSVEMIVMSSQKENGICAGFDVLRDVFLASKEFFWLRYAHVGESYLNVYCTALSQIGQDFIGCALPEPLLIVILFRRFV